MTLRVARAAKVIGIPVTQAECESVMDRLGFAWTAAPGTITVVPPSWRFDIRIEEDLIEEVIRLLGYDRLDAAPPRGTLAAHVPSEARRPPARLRQALADLGWQETIGFSFVDERWERDFAGNARPVRVLNPIAQSLSVMRSSLIGSLVEVLKVNLARKSTRLRLFELGKVYLRDPGVPAGDTAVAGLRQPLQASAASPSGRRRRCSGAKPSARSTSSTSRAISKRCSGAPGRASFRPRIRRFIRDAAPRSSSTATGSASSASCTRAGARPTSCPATRSCSRSMPRRCCAGRCRPSSRCRSSSRPGATSPSSPGRA